ncbi:MAG: hypothetical protein GY765_30265 [bacterium]|nr:hypothetical protein [bacterium]
MIRPLISKEPLSPSIVGGKAAGLNRLATSGYDVPPGFVVTTEAYEQFLSANGLKEKILVGFQKLEAEDAGDLEDIFQEIRTCIEEAPLPEIFVNQIESSVAQLGASRVAVRSSAVNEDLPGASFAGLMDSFLNVPTDDLPQLCETVKKCFASLYNSHAVLYRQRKGFDQHKPIAVICQEMVEPDFAGVLFTRDPLEKKNILLEIAAGSGENVVSGIVTPDSYLICRDTLDILESEQSEESSIETSTQASIQTGWIRQLAQTGLEIEQRFNGPQDIEFALLNDRLCLLQARHITTLK